MIKLPKELEPIERDYIFYDKEYGMCLEDTDYYFKEAWNDYIGMSVKDDFTTYKDEMKDDWRDEKENEGGVPPFVEWHESVHDFTPTFKDYVEHNMEQIISDFGSYLVDLVSPSDYFEDEVV